MRASPNHDSEPSTDMLVPQHDLIITNYLSMSSYELVDDTMTINDAVWGHEHIGDGEYDSLLVELARHPLLRRLQAVEQLTLPPAYTTVPNTSLLSRWQHIWGSVVFVRKMTANDERFSERDSMALQLRTLFSDVGQTAFSHLGDWLFQDGTSQEDLHDQELRSLLEGFGIGSILDRYGFTLDETVFPDRADWVECPSPELCVDRVDYGLRELLRWMSPPSMLHAYTTALKQPTNLFQINDQNMLEVTNPDFAHHFATAYNLLPTEHWSQPVHRLQLSLMQTAVKRALLDGYFSEGIALSTQAHPRDRLYGIDADFQPSFQDWDGIAITGAMRAIGSAQRRIYNAARQHDLDHVLNRDSTGEFPDPLAELSWQSQRYGLVAPQVEIESTDATTNSVTQGAIGLQFDLPALKPRSIDPIVVTGNGSRRLSEISNHFATFRQGQSVAMARSYRASLLVNKHTTNSLYSTISSVNERWQKAVEKPRNLTDLTEIVGQAAMYAAGARLDKISDY